MARCEYDGRATPERDGRPDPGHRSNYTPSDIVPVSRSRRASASHPSSSAWHRRPLRPAALAVRPCEQLGLSSRPGRPERSEVSEILTVVLDNGAGEEDGHSPERLWIGTRQPRT